MVVGGVFSTWRHYRCLGARNVPVSVSRRVDGMYNQPNASYLPDYLSTWLRTQVRPFLYCLIKCEVGWKGNIKQKCYSGEDLYLPLLQVDLFLGWQVFFTLLCLSTSGNDLCRKLSKQNQTSESEIKNHNRKSESENRIRNLNHKSLLAHNVKCVCYSEVTGTESH